MIEEENAAVFLQLLSRRGLSLQLFRRNGVSKRVLNHLTKEWRKYEATADVPTERDRSLRGTLCRHFIGVYELVGFAWSWRLCLRRVAGPRVDTRVLVGRSLVGGVVGRLITKLSHFDFTYAYTIV